MSQGMGWGYDVIGQGCDITVTSWEWSDVIEVLVTSWVW